uniref:CACTA en-spm transposon protein n=1 Tax=Angiostrongylus cantonensis TaxID=6313 RepID=A0A158P5V6_ANGCA
MTVVGIIAKDGEASDYVVGEEFRVCVDTKVTYISRYYRHVFVLDLSPSTLVAFTIPGTRRIFCPQIYVSVCVFIPFLAFEQDLVLVQGILLTESNINSVLHTVTQKFNDLLNGLYDYSKGILQKWGTLRRRHRVSNNITSRGTSFPARNIMDYAKGVWSVSTTEDENSTRNPLCDGYVHPEWALIFMLRLGLIAVQMMPENTQSS